MQNPESEIRDVVRSITEPYEAQVIADNVAKLSLACLFTFSPFPFRKALMEGALLTRTFL